MEKKEEDEEEEREREEMVKGNEKKLEGKMSFLPIEFLSTCLTCCSCFPWGNQYIVDVCIHMCVLSCFTGLDACG